MSIEKKIIKGRVVELVHKNFQIDSTNKYEGSRFRAGYIIKLNGINLSEVIEDKRRADKAFRFVCKKLRA